MHKEYHEKHDHLDNMETHHEALFKNFCKAAFCNERRGTKVSRVRGGNLSGIQSAATAEGGVGLTGWR